MINKMVMGLNEMVVIGPSDANAPNLIIAARIDRRKKRGAAVYRVAITAAAESMCAEYVEFRLKRAWVQVRPLCRLYRACRVCRL